MTRMLTGGLCALMFAAVAKTDVAAAGAACEALSSLKLPDTTITLAHAVEAGTFAQAIGKAHLGILPGQIARQAICGAARGKVDCQSCLTMRQQVVTQSG